MRLYKYRVQKYVSKLDVFFCTVNGEKVSSRSRKAHTHTGWVSLCTDKIHCLKPQPERQLENWKFPTCKLRLPCEMTKPLFDRIREYERFSANFVQHSTRLLYLLPSSSPRRKLFHFIFISLYIRTERSERDEWMKTKFLALLMEEKKNEVDWAVWMAHIRAPRAAHGALRAVVKLSSASTEAAHCSLGILVRTRWLVDAVFVCCLWIVFG